MPQPPRVYLKTEQQRLEEVVDTCVNSFRKHLIRDLRHLGFSSSRQKEQGICIEQGASPMSRDSKTNSLDMCLHDHQEARLTHSRSNAEFSNASSTIGNKDKNVFDKRVSLARMLGTSSCNSSQVIGRPSTPASPCSSITQRSTMRHSMTSSRERRRRTSASTAESAKRKASPLDIDTRFLLQKSKSFSAQGHRPNLASVLEKARTIHCRKTRESQAIEQTWKTYWQRPDVEQCFDGIVALLIMLNVIQIGVSTDLGKGWPGWLVLDTFFATAFTFEFCFKMWIHGWDHLCGKMWAWSSFDVFIVSLAIGELALNMFFKSDDDGDGIGFSVFRIVRLCRLTRILKIIRLPVFKDLLAMIDGLIYGSRTLFWSLCLLVTPIYSMAIMMRETVGNQTRTLENHHYVTPFQSFPWSFFTCFRCIMGDCSTETGQPIFVLLSQNLSGAYGLGFSVILAVTTFGLFNVIIAIYVDNIQMAAKRSDSAYLQMRLQDDDRSNALMGELVRLFVSLRKRSSETDNYMANLLEVCATDASSIEFSREEFMEVAQVEEVQSLFDQLDIMPENRVGLFDALDADGGGSLSLMEILNGLQMLRGEPRRADTIANYMVLRNMQERSDDDKHEMNGAFRELKNAVRDFCEQYRNARVPDTR